MTGFRTDWLCYVGRQNLFGNCRDVLGMILKSDDLEQLYFVSAFGSVPHCTLERRKSIKSVEYK
jgi:hypothetical protein